MHACRSTLEDPTRGYYLQNLIDIGWPWAGIVFSSIAFCLLHAANPAAESSFIIPLNLFGAGIVFALVYQASGNIWFPTAMHFGWNFAQGVLFEAPISGLKSDGLLDVQRVTTMPDWLTGGEFGIEGSLLVTAVEIGLALLFWSILQKRLGAATTAVDRSRGTDQTAASGAA